MFVLKELCELGHGVFTQYMYMTGIQGNIDPLGGLHHITLYIDIAMH